MQWNNDVQHYDATDNFEIPYASLLIPESICFWQECEIFPNIQCH